MHEIEKLFNEIETFLKKLLFIFNIRFIAYKFNQFQDQNPFSYKAKDGLIDGLNEFLLFHI